MITATNTRAACARIRSTDKRLTRLVMPHKIPPRTVPKMVGKLFGHNRIIEKLGGGGMGVVYKAEDTKLARFVALKFLPLEMSQDRQAMERFKREARAAPVLNQPHICAIYYLDVRQSRQYIAMELLEGNTLRRRIAGRPMTAEQVAKPGVQMSEALEAAHAKGIVHRDLKPINVLSRMHPLMRCSR